jgi:3D (Asp-Asp-Asp) domain-containing protein
MINKFQLALLVAIGGLAIHGATAACGGVNSKAIPDASRLLDAQASDAAIGNEWVDDKVATARSDTPSAVLRPQGNSSRAQQPTSPRQTASMTQPMAFRQAAESHVPTSAVYGSYIATSYHNPRSHAGPVPVLDPRGRELSRVSGRSFVDAAMEGSAILPNGAQVTVSRFHVPSDPAAYGSTHDGWVVADDHGGNITKNRIDLLAGNDDHEFLGGLIHVYAIP